MEDTDKKVLPELESDDTTKVWTVQDKTHKKHTFKYVDSRHVLCECGIGYEMAGELTLKEGHVYFKNELLI